MSVIPLDTFGRNMEIATVFSNMTVISIILSFIIQKVNWKLQNFGKIMNDMISALLKK